MKKIYILLLLLPLCFPIQAQRILEIRDKAFNWGGKVGFNSTFPIINSLTISDKPAENVRLQYKVGYMAAAFARVNIERFFIQPSLSWRYSQGDIRFDIQQSNNFNDPTGESSVKSKNQIEYKTGSLELPVMVGYYLVREAPYALSFMVGPNIRYTYKSNYTANLTETLHEYKSDSTPFGISIATGLGVSIWRLFFDFTYEFGLNQVESGFKEKNSNLPAENNMIIDKRTNTMSFSLGFLF